MELEHLKEGLDPKSSLIFTLICVSILHDIAYFCLCPNGLCQSGGSYKYQIDAKGILDKLHACMSNALSRGDDNF